MVPIEIKIPKEIRNYHENIFFGLNTRQFVCSLLALGAAVGLYFCLRPIVGAEQVGWMCILGAAPFAACGFFSYHGMTAEQLLWAWIKSEILMPKRLAAASGTVTVANALDSWGGGYGYYVRIDHGGGLETLYAHCSSICVTAGQQVQAGQVIGYVGQTGCATGNHLHFEVYQNGQRADAMAYFATQTSE